MSQLALPFVWPPSPTDDDFLISACNDAAVRHLRHWGRWPVMASLLVGPRKSGRSLLARLFEQHSGGRVIDDAERVSEAELFHAWNAAQAQRQPLLLVAQAAPPEWRIRLPDLQSRLAATPRAMIAEPDVALMAALFERAFLRRGLDARPELLNWLVLRLERRYLTIERAVDLLDSAALAGRRRLSIPLARTTLEPAGLILPRAAADKGDDQ